MAAVAPSTSDARVPCPACGTLIHPVAGRCKHCKQDIAQLRALRPAANAALPALAPRATPVAGTPTTAAPESAPVSSPTATTLAADAFPGVIAPKIASPFPNGEVERAYDPTRPVLPPRTMGHGVVKKESWFARNWPIVVIVLASAAIIGAVILMMLPPKEAGAGKKNGAGAPAPDRMDTDKLPEQQPKPDPWSGASPTPAPTPPPAQAAPDPQLGQQQPDPSTAPDPNDPLAPDPFAGGLPSINQNGIALSQALAAHLCDKAAACGSSDPTTQQLCSAMAAMPKMSIPQNCAAAKECLDTIDRMDVCGAMANSIDPLQVIQTAQSCIKAMSSC